MSAERGQVNVLRREGRLRVHSRGPRRVPVRSHAGPRAGRHGAGERWREEPASHELAAAPAAADTTARRRATPAAPTPAARSTQALPRLLDLGADHVRPLQDDGADPRRDEGDVRRASSTVDFIDVRTDKAAAKQYGIQVIPTQIFFDASGKELFRHQGFFSREDILAKWKELGVELDG